VYLRCTDNIWDWIIAPAMALANGKALKYEVWRNGTKSVHAENKCKCTVVSHTMGKWIRMKLPTTYR
jgi:hypothetical protein